MDVSQGACSIKRAAVSRYTVVFWPVPIRYGDSCREETGFFCMGFVSVAKLGTDSHRRVLAVVWRLESGLPDFQHPCPLCSLHGGDDRWRVDLQGPGGLVTGMDVQFSAVVSSLLFFLFLHSKDEDKQEQVREKMENNSDKDLFPLHCSLPPPPSQ